jgi:hypothetical protein
MRVSLTPVRVFGRGPWIGLAASGLFLAELASRSAPWGYWLRLPVEILLGLLMFRYLIYGPVAHRLRRRRSKEGDDGPVG